MTGRSTLKKRSAFERLLSGFILRIGMLVPLAGVGGVAVTQYLPCRKSAFSYRAAASNESIAGWRPGRLSILASKSGLPNATRHSRICQRARTRGWYKARRADTHHRLHQRGYGRARDPRESGRAHLSAAYGAVPSPAAVGNARCRAGAIRSSSPAGTGLRVQPSHRLVAETKPPALRSRWASHGVSHTGVSRLGNAALGRTQATPGSRFDCERFPGRCRTKCPIDLRYQGQGYSLVPQLESLSILTNWQSFAH